jgi:hypothetical protein
MNQICELRFYQYLYSERMPSKVEYARTDEVII